MYHSENVYQSFLNPGTDLFDCKHNSNNYTRESESRRFIYLPGKGPLISQEKPL